MLINNAFLLLFLHFLSCYSIFTIDDIFLPSVKVLDLYCIVERVIFSYSWVGAQKETHSPVFKENFLEE
jgi:hypothetical protein